MHRARTLSPSKKASKFSPTTDDLLLEASNQEDSNLVSSLIKGFQGISSLNVNAKNSFGSTALHLATFHGKLDNVKELLQVRDVEVNCQDIYLRTPAFFAARNGRKEILQLLLERNADVNIPNKYGETALSKASYYGHEECVRLLLQQKRCQSIPDTIFGNNALHNAAMRGHLSCIQCGEWKEDRHPYRFRELQWIHWITLGNHLQANRSSKVIDSIGSEYSNAF